MHVETALQEFDTAPSKRSNQGQLAARDWSLERLPLTWPDRPRSAFRLWWGLLSAPFERGKKRAELPVGLPGKAIPAYATEQFHGLPNGYYSHNIAEGYDKGFEASMLYLVQKARRRMADQMNSGRVLDVGCGSGRLVAELLDVGADEVWGLDPSPYMLKIAQGRSPKARFEQGLIEDNDFEDEFFDAAGACFLFHELPASVTQRAIAQLWRVLKPGGTLCITEPAREHIYEKNLFRLMKNYGFRGLYFHFLAKGVYEPYLEDWQGLGDHSAWLEDCGFELIEKVVDVPFQFLVARKKQRPALCG